MKPPAGPAFVLDYHRPRAAGRLGRWLLIQLGLLPFVIELIAIVNEGLTGDPPNNLAEFQAYHYSIGLSLVLALCWLLLVARAAYKARRWWMLLFAGGWFAWVCWVGVWFLRELNAHPAAAYYWDLWRR